MKKHIIKLTKGAVFFAIAFCFCLLGWISLPSALFAKAESEYLQVKSSDLTVQSYGKYTNNYYSIVLEYAGNEDLPNDPTGFDNYVLEVDGKEFCVCDKNGAQLNLWYVSHNGTAKTLIFMFKTASSGDKIAYKDAEIDTLTISKDAILGAPNQTDYAGILFVDGLTLVKINGAWTVDIQETETNYEIALTAENVSVFFENQTLNVAITTPFTSEIDVEYETELAVSLNDEPQSYLAWQAAGAEKLVFSIEDYSPMQGNEIPCLTVSSGVLIAANGTQIMLTGQAVFYEYVDGSWAKEKYVQIQETVFDITTEKKLSADDAYAFTKPQAQTDKLFCGWRYGNKALQTGAQLALAEYNERTLKTEAIFVGYQSITGASIRYDSAGESSGIRFGAVLSQADFETFSDCILGVGMIVMPQNLLTEKEFTLENYNGENQAKNFFATKDNISTQGTSFTLYASIVKVLQTNYNRAFCARAYLLVDNGVDGGEYVWCSATEKRSVYEVATAAIERDRTEGKLLGWQTDILEIYINGVANIAYQDGVATVLCSASVPAVKEVRVSVSGNVVTLVLTTQIQNFPGILYNGKRVRNAEQAYENGELTVVFDESKAEE